MKTKIHLFLSVVTYLFLMLFVSLKSYAFDYNITFTGTGASTTVESVIVQNLTKGTTVTVPTGNSLKLSDAPNAVEQLNADDETIRVYPNSVEGKSIVSFFAKQAGSTQLNAFSIDGRKVAGITENLQTGVNSFQLSFPKGSFVIQVVGNGYTYTAKMINQTGTVRKPEITYIGTVKQATSAPQKSKSSAPGTTTMNYATGDLLLYKAVSGNYSTIVTDVPTASKNMNFVFVTCQDADLNNYSVVTIGTQTWMAENLKTKKYSNGDAIGTPNYQWAYNGDENLAAKYGRLYTWYAIADSRNIAPTGWHVASDAEWTTLENYLIANGYNYDGTTTGNKIAKSLASTTDWYSYTDTGAIGNDLIKNNTSGFSALPGGYRNTDGAFDDVGSNGLWWSSSEYDGMLAWYRDLYYYLYDLSWNYGSKSYGFSVRCVIGDIPVLSTTLTSISLIPTLINGGLNAVEIGYILNLAVAPASPVKALFNTQTVSYNINPSTADLTNTTWRFSTNQVAVQVKKFVNGPQSVSSANYTLFTSPSGNMITNPHNDGTRDFLLKVNTWSEPTTGYSNLFALEATTNGSSVISDYAKVIPVQYNAFISNATKLTAPFTHYRTAIPLIGDVIDFELVNDNSIVTDLDNLVWATATNSAGLLEKKFADYGFGTVGVDYKFEFSTSDPYFAYDGVTNQNSFVSLDPTTHVVTVNPGSSSIDRHPLVTVKLKTMSGNLLAQAYIKFKITGTSNPVNLPLTFNVPTETFLYSSLFKGNAVIANNVSDIIVTGSLMNAIYTGLGLSHNDFQANYGGITPTIAVKVNGVAVVGATLAQYPLIRTLLTPDVDTYKMKYQVTPLAKFGLTEITYTFNTGVITDAVVTIKFSFNVLKPTLDKTILSGYQYNNSPADVMTQSNQLYLGEPFGFGSSAYRNLFGTATAGKVDGATHQFIPTALTGAMLSVTSPTTIDGCLGTTASTGTLMSLTTSLTTSERVYAMTFRTTYPNGELDNLAFNVHFVNGTVTDIDGNIYHTVTIGTQVWLIENLKTTHYRDGSSIANVADNTAWAGLLTGAWCDYSNTAANGIKYGHLYNWYAVADSRNIAPVGWHVPTDAEWTTLENYLIANGYNYDGTTSVNKIAESLASTTDWYSSDHIGEIGYDLTKNNSSGFTALPGGSRYYGGVFDTIGYYGYWWSSTEGNAADAWYRSLAYFERDLYGNDMAKSYGFSVRCVRDY